MIEVFEHGFLIDEEMAKTIENLRKDFNKQIQKIRRKAKKTPWTAYYDYLTLRIEHPFSLFYYHVKPMNKKGK